MQDRRRILFVGQGVTLAHVVRPYTLCASLDAQRYERHFACPREYWSLLDSSGIRMHNHASISKERFLSALDSGGRIYRPGEFEREVKADVALIEEVRPDIIVGDFRLSLSVSARVAGVPYVNITNSYWSHLSGTKLCASNHPLTRWLGQKAADWIFSVFGPFVFSLQIREFEKVRRKFGFEGLGTDFRSWFCDGDKVLFADIPVLSPEVAAQAESAFLGPIDWEPTGSLPPWWDEWDRKAPYVYVCLGSSGDSTLVPQVLEALSYFPVTIVFSSAGEPIRSSDSNTIFSAPYLPGKAVAQGAALVICNGGSPSTYQALAAGTPVLGICRNMDQCLNMQRLERYGAGAAIRSGSVTPERLKTLIARFLENSDYKDGALKLQQQILARSPREAFESVIQDTLALR